MKHFVSGSPAGHTGADTTGAKRHRTRLFCSHLRIQLTLTVVMFALAELSQFGGESLAQPALRHAGKQANSARNKLRGCVPAQVTVDLDNVSVIEAVTAACKSAGIAWRISSAARGLIEGLGATNISVYEARQRILLWSPAQLGESTGSGADNSVFSIRNLPAKHQPVTRR